MLICPKETFDEFDTFYDVCCDHGVLGFQLAHEKPSSQIHFVDVVPSIIENLKLKKHALSISQCDI